MKRLIYLFLISLSTSFGQLVCAQQAKVSPGDKVRVQAPMVASKQMEGIVINTFPKYFMLAVDSAEIDIPWQSINRLEIRHRKRNSVKGLIIGGISCAFIFGVGTEASRSTSNDYIGPVFTGVEAAGIGLLFGGIIGGIVGTFVRTDKWERIPVQISLAPTNFKPNKKIALKPTVSLRFSF